MPSIYKSYIPGVSHVLIKDDTVLESYSSIQEIADKYCNVVKVCLDMDNRKYDFSQCERVCRARLCEKVSGILDE